MNETSCYTCLSLDRKLKPLKPRVGYLFTMLCPEICYKDYSQYLICWECESMINKIKQFQDRLTKATSTLKLHKKGKTVIFEGLSSLKLTEVVTISVIPQSISNLPQNKPTLLQHTTILPQNTPLPSMKEMLVAPSGPDQQTFTIKMEEEDEESCLGSDYDELIQPSTIQQLSKDPLMIPVQDKPEIKKKLIEIEVLPREPVKYETVAPKGTNYLPQRVFINAPKQHVALRGSKEPVKVTVSVPNLVTRKVLKPSTVKTEESTPVNVQEKLGVLNFDKLLTKLLKTPSKHEEFLMKKYDSNTHKEPECSEQGTGDEDEPKTISLDINELNTLRDQKRSNPAFIASQFKCVKCVEWYLSQDKLDEHNKKHGVSQGASICEICEQRFPDDLNRNEHQELHFTIFGCPHCPYKNTNRHKVSEHIRHTHEESSFYCKECHAVFKTFMERRRHIRSAHSKKIKCEECEKSFPRNQLRPHMVNVHQGETVECRICKKRLKKYSLKNHMKIHEEKRDIFAYCMDCGTSYKSKNSYDIHLKNSLKHNTLEKLGIKCDHCNEYFSSKLMLKNHVEEIIGVKYTCDICKKDSKNKRVLIRHIQRVHEGKKPIYKHNMCEICGKSFTKKKSLVEHINSHLGRRTHVCKDCGATFVYSAALYTHRRLVHKEKKKKLK